MDDTPHHLAGGNAKPPPRLAPMADINVKGRHICGDAKVFGESFVSDDARVTGDAVVYEGSWIYGDAVICDGIINRQARIKSTADVVQVIVDGVCWSRFATAEGYHTTPHKAPPAMVQVLFDAWEADRG